MGIRILVTTAMGRRIAAGGRFATHADARAWAESLARTDAVVGDVVEVVPDDAEPLGKYPAVRALNADLREALAGRPVEVENPDELLDIRQVAAHWGVSVQSVETGVHNGHKPDPDEGSGRMGKWKRITVARWDAEAPLRRERS